MKVLDLWKAGACVVGAIAITVGCSVAGTGIGWLVCTLAQTLA